MQKKIAITGGIGSGKSLAASYIAEMGYPTFSCDKINRELLSDSEYVKKIEASFPACVIDGKINKSALKNVVFNNKASLQMLNEIAHPIIMKRLHLAMEQCDDTLVFAEVPLLFEGGFENDFDEVIVITRSLAKRIESVKNRDKLSEQEIRERISQQFDYTHLDERIKNIKAYVVQNEGDELTLKNQICSIVETLK